MAKEQNIKPKHAYLQYEVLQSLDISINEYFYLDMVYYLSRGGWCYKSLDNIAKDMKLTRNGVSKMRDRLASQGLIIKGKANRVKTSEKYNSVYFLNDSNSQKHTQYQKKHTEYTSERTLSIHKTNNETNKDYNTNSFGEGYEYAKGVREKLQRSLSL